MKLINELEEEVSLITLYLMYSGLPTNQRDRKTGKLKQFRKKSC